MNYNSGIVLQDVDVSLEAKVVSRPLNSKWRLEKYPDTYMPFYLYGNGKPCSCYYCFTCSEAAVV